ncbi:MAG: hypothetical protein WKG07_45165 [Hymenobacter sp.]
MNLFILGPGNVGGQLLAQLAQQQQYLREKLGLDLRGSGHRQQPPLPGKRRGRPRPAHLARRPRCRARADVRRSLPA